MAETAIFSGWTFSAITLSAISYFIIWYNHTSVLYEHIKAFMHACVWYYFRFIYCQNQSTIDCICIYVRLREKVERNNIIQKFRCRRTNKYVYVCILENEFLWVICWKTIFTSPVLYLPNTTDASTAWKYTWGDREEHGVIGVHRYSILRSGGQWGVLVKYVKLTPMSMVVSNSSTADTEKVCTHR